jgi:glycolate oxidase
MVDAETLSILKTRLSDVVGEANVSTSVSDMILNAHDAWPLSEARIRAGELLPTADMIVFPATTEEVAEVLKIANETSVPVTPI